MLMKYERRMLDVCESAHPLAQFMLLKAASRLTESRLQSPMIVRIIEKCLPTHTGEIAAFGEEIDEVFGFAAKAHETVGAKVSDLPEVTSLLQTLFSLVTKVVRVLPRLNFEQTFREHLRLLSCLRPMMDLCFQGGSTSFVESLLGYAVDSLSDNDSRRLVVSCAIVSYVPPLAVQDNGTRVAKLVQRAFQLLCNRLAAGIGLMTRPDRAQALCIAAGNALACMYIAGGLPEEGDLSSVLSLLGDVGAALQAIGVQALSTLGRELALAVLSACELATGTLRFLLRAAQTDHSGDLRDEARVQCMKLVPVASDLFSAPTRAIKIAASDLFTACASLLLDEGDHLEDDKDRSLAASRDLLWQVMDGTHTAVRQARISASLSCAAIAGVAGLPFVIPWFLTEYVTSQSVSAQYIVLKGLAFSLSRCRITPDNFDGFARVMDVVVALLSDAAEARERIFRQLAAELSMSMVSGVPRSFISTVGSEEKLLNTGQFRTIQANTLEILTHCVNVIFPNVLDTTDSNFRTSIFEAVSCLLGAMGGYGIRYLWAGMYHPAKRVRDAYAHLYAEIVRCFPVSLLGIGLRRDIGQLAVYTDGISTDLCRTAPGPVIVPRTGESYYSWAMALPPHTTPSSKVSCTATQGIFKGAMADAPSWAPELDWRV